MSRFSNRAHTAATGAGDRSLAAKVRFGFGVGITPAVARLAFETASRANVPASLGEALAYGGAALLATAGLAVAATYEASLAMTAVIATAALAALVVVARSLMGPMSTVLAVDAALVALAWALGSSVGRRVQHAGHLLPACIVAASADVISILSPEGPSHLIARSEKGLTVFATWFPVPGTHFVAPALGLGDLSFMGLLFGVARAHKLPYAKCVGLCLLGTALAGALASALHAAVPALVPIALCVLIFLPQARALRSADRRAARLSIVIALSFVLACVARRALASLF